MHTVGGNVKNFHYESFSINEKYNYYMIQQFHFYLFKEITLIRKHLCIPCLLQHQPQYGSNLKYLIVLKPSLQAYSQLVLTEVALLSYVKLLSHVQVFVIPCTVACQAPLFMESSENGQSFPSPRDFPNPELDPESPALQADSFTV